MADKSTEEMTTEEKLAYAKELYGRGSRNFLVRDYAEAADDLSEVCSLYAEIHGDNADELGMPYLLYAKSLIALAQQGENKVLDVPDEEEDEDEEEGDDEEDADESNKDAKDAEAAGSSSTTTTNGTNGLHAAATNGEGSSSNIDPQPGSSSGVQLPPSVDTDAPPEEDEDTPAANLQIAWEILELAVNIFSRHRESSGSNLADAYFELAEISFENSHFETALRDYRNSLEIRMKLPDDDLRVIAELHYKIGLSHLMLNTFEDSIVAFKQACEALDAEKEAQRTKPDQADSETTILELEELKAEILIKIAEVEESKQQSIDEVRQELAKLIPQPSNDGAGSSSSSSGTTAAAGSSSTPSAAGASSASMATTATDISHLIKRKKPDTAAIVTDNTDEGSPAKRPNV